MHTGSAIHRHRFVVCLDRNVRASPTPCAYAASFHVRVGYNGDDLHHAYSDVAVLQKLYDIAESRAALAISLMEEDS